MEKKMKENQMNDWYFDNVQPVQLGADPGVIPTLAQEVVPISMEEMQQIQKEIEEDISLVGFQVVRREFFSHKYDPTLTIKGDSIIFNTACVRMLDKVVYIQFMVYPDRELLVIKPCAQGDKDAIRWCTIKEDGNRKSRLIKCDIFAAKLYELMGWERVCYYKLQGYTRKYRGQLVYTFNLSETEAYLPQHKDGTLNWGAPMYPESWRDSFGMLYEELEKLTDIDLDEDFERAEPESVEGSAEVPVEKELVLA